jgi:transposase-like protein
VVGRGEGVAMKKKPAKKAKPNEIEMPVCERCGTNKHVKYVGPDWVGSEFRCSKCRDSWAQSF